MRLGYVKYPLLFNNSVDVAVRNILAANLERQGKPLKDVKNKKVGML